jgi:hypothetical protein
VLHTDTVRPSAVTAVLRRALSAVIRAFGAASVVAGSEAAASAAVISVVVVVSEAAASAAVISVVVVDSGAAAPAAAIWGDAARNTTNQRLNGRGRAYLATFMIRCVCWHP